jgi:hypothetical protein
MKRDREGKKGPCLLMHYLSPYPSNLTILFFNKEDDKYWKKTTMMPMMMVMVTMRHRHVERGLESDLVLGIILGTTPILPFRPSSSSLQSYSKRAHPQNERGQTNNVNNSLFWSNACGKIEYGH